MPEKWRGILSAASWRALQRLKRRIGGACVILAFLVVPIHGQRYVKLTQAQWNRTEIIKDFDWRECKGTLERKVYRTKKGKKLVTLTTFDDDCDGGNVYGVIKNSRGRVVAHVRDGDVFWQSYSDQRRFGSGHPDRY